MKLTLLMCGDMQDAEACLLKALDLGDEDPFLKAELLDQLEQLQDRHTRALSMPASALAAL